MHIPTLEDAEYDAAQTEDEQTQPSVVAASESASVSGVSGNLDTSVTSSYAPSEIITAPAYDVTASENSFMPASNAVSSTPARPGHAAPDRTVDEQPSWNASLESPMVRLKRELQRSAREELEEEQEASVLQPDMSSYADSIM